MAAQQKIKERLQQLRVEADSAIERAEAAETKKKSFEQALLERDNELKSLRYRLKYVDTSADAVDKVIQSLKRTSLDGDKAKELRAATERKAELLQDKLDTVGKDLKEAVANLRTADIRAENAERQMKRVEQERDRWEKKYEDANAKYLKSKAEVDELTKGLEDF